MKLPLLLMAVATVLVAMGLRWREERMGGARPRGFVAGKKAAFNRWLTAAAIAAVGTSVLLGILHWAQF
ncbi:hypothetical protein ACI6QG_04865 [Roseococcus sp. DSY-14]|uniref:hypothetical protein n=1 Tax=Roseococcus sp. DSY-14 TaxID=3369650 RepID=UPI00387AADFE